MDAKPLFRDKRVFSAFEAVKFTNINQPKSWTGSTNLAKQRTVETQNSTSKSPKKTQIILNLAKPVATPRHRRSSIDSAGMSILQRSNVTVISVQVQQNKNSSSETDNGEPTTHKTRAKLESNRVPAKETVTELQNWAKRRNSDNLQVDHEVLKLLNTISNARHLFLALFVRISVIQLSRSWI